MQLQLVNTFALQMLLGKVAQLFLKLVEQAAQLLH
jgi:hypothetical protein